MKIYTITCHDVYNHGASLQAYALQRHLTEAGHDVEIIDYKPAYLTGKYDLLRVDNPKWERNILAKIIYLTIKFPLRVRELERKKAFDAFTRNHLRLTERQFAFNIELKRALPEADAYICGSDQIWNSLFQNGRDPAFYLDFADDRHIKLSYAASFATDDIEPETIPFVKDMLNHLDGISVRERSGVEILKKMDIHHAINVVDPAFLLDRDDWEEIGSRDVKGDYIFVYDFDNSELIRNCAIRIAKRKGMQIYSINPGKMKYADKQFKYVGPETFISLIKNAAFVISNSYHAMVLSVIFRKQFAIVNRKESINTRMRDLLAELNLSERLIEKDENLDVVLGFIDYNEVETRLQDWIDSSKAYLEQMLRDEKRASEAL